MRWGSSVSTAEVRRGQGTASELTRRVYGQELGEELLVDAEMTTRAHLQKLVDEGTVRISAGTRGEVFLATAGGKVQ